MGLAISSFLTLSDESTTASIKGARCADKDDFPTPGKPQMMTINNYTVLYMDFRARAYYLLLLNGTKIHAILAHLDGSLLEAIFFRSLHVIATSTKGNLIYTSLTYPKCNS